MVLRTNDVGGQRPRSLRQAKGDRSGYSLASHLLTSHLLTSDLLKSDLLTSDLLTSDLLKSRRAMQDDGATGVAHDLGSHAAEPEPIQPGAAVRAGEDQ